MASTKLNCLTLQIVTVKDRITAHPPAWHAYVHNAQLHNYISVDKSCSGHSSKINYTAIYMAFTVSYMAWEASGRNMQELCGMVIKTGANSWGVKTTRIIYFSNCCHQMPYNFNPICQNTILAKSHNIIQYCAWLVIILVRPYPVKILLIMKHSHSVCAHQQQFLQQCWRQ